MRQAIPALQGMYSFFRVTLTLNGHLHIFRTFNKGEQLSNFYYSFFFVNICPHYQLAKPYRLDEVCIAFSVLPLPWMDTCIFSALLTKGSNFLASTSMALLFFFFFFFFAHIGPHYQCAKPFRLYKVCIAFSVFITLMIFGFCSLTKGSIFLTFISLSLFFLLCAERNDYSRPSMVRTPLGPWKYVRDSGRSN